MDVKLLRMKIQHFKGIKEFEITTNGKNVDVYGKNGAGKTTMYDAFLWLLFDKDSSGRKEFAIKPLNEEGTSFGTGIQTSVEAQLEMDAEKTLLRKVYYEKWTRKSGQAAKEFAGHTTDYFIDEVPVSRGQYAEHIRKIVDEKVFRLLTDVHFFNEGLKWQERREILFSIAFSIAGPISKKEVFQSDPELQELENILGDREVEDMKKILGQARKKLQADLEKIPERIDEATRGMNDACKDRSEVQKELEKLEAEKAGLLKSLEDSAQGRYHKADAHLLKARQNLELLEARNARYRAEQESDWHKKERERLRPAQEKYEQASREKAELAWELQKTQKETSEWKDKLNQLRQEWVKAQREIPETPSRCPTCEQPWPMEKARSFQRSFEEDKRRKLRALAQEGENVKRKGEKAAQNGRLLQEKLEECERKLRDFAQMELFPAPEIQDLPTYREEKEALVGRIERIENLRQTFGKEMEEERQKNGGLLEEMNQKIEEKQKILAADAVNRRQKARVEELKQALKDTTKELEAVERKRYLLDAFIRKQAERTEEKINGLFQRTRFKLFENFINEGLKDVCLATWGGVPYPDVNTAGKINCGLDVIQTLSRFYGVKAPIFIDHAESVTDLIPSDGQTIRLIVSDEDEKLRVVTKEKASGMQAIA